MKNDQNENCAKHFIDYPHHSEQLDDSRKDNLITDTIYELYKYSKFSKHGEQSIHKILSDLYAKGENEKWVKNNELAYEAGKAAGREEGIGDGFYRGQVLGEKKARAEFAKEVHAKILSMKDEKTTGIYRLVNAHELVCWLQESELKDL